MNKLKQKEGITLIALVITIIVMLILVAVTINMAVNGGLFGYAGNAARQTNEAIEQEKTLGDVESGLTTEQLIAKYTEGSTEYGYNEAEKVFIGRPTEDTHRTQNGNVAYTNGYKFTEGHFVYKENYTYFVWNDQTSDWDEQTGNVYLCWDEDGIEPSLRTSEVGYWDVYSTSGAFLSNGHHDARI